MRLIDSLGVTEELAGVFSDASVLAAMQEFESALARAQAAMGMIPAGAADAIGRATDLDAAVIAREARLQATPAIPFVKELTSRVRAIDEPAAGFVHWGATSQDVVDTALVLLLRRVQEIFARDQERLLRALRSLSQDHAGTVMMARTLLQPAAPITFGYKAAAWHGSIRRSGRRLSQSLDQAIQLQFGGACGTLASYGTQGLALAVELGRQLNLKVPAAPWHAHRERLAAVVADCGIYCGGLGKIARDVSLLMQHEVGEVSETGGGGSSAMPHKRNPAGSAVALAAAARVPGLVSGYLSGMVQEHERAVGGLQAEWQTVSAVVEATGSALAAVAATIEGLAVFPDRMRANIASTRGAIFSEKAVMSLAATMGRAAAQDAVAKAIASGEALDSTDDYLGASETFRRRLLEEEEE